MVNSVKGLGKFHDNDISCCSTFHSSRDFRNVFMHLHLTGSVLAKTILLRAQNVVGLLVIHDGTNKSYEHVFRNLARDTSEGDWPVIGWVLVHFIFYTHPHPCINGVGVAGYSGITLSFCSSVHVSSHVCSISPESLNHFFHQTWYGGVLSQGDVSCGKTSSLSSISRSQHGLK